MKKKIVHGIQFFIAFILFNLSAFVAFAQEKGIDVDINVKKETAWYQQPWIWVVGGAIFILLLAAILRGNTSKE
jgi:hypothetical protein